MEYKKLAWDSDFFAFPISVLKNAKETSIAAPKENCKLIYVIGESYIESIEGYQENFRGDKMLFKKDLALIKGEDSFQAAVNAPSEPLHILDSPEKLNSRLEELAIVAGSFSRFNLDSNFSSAEFQKLYKHWIQASLGGAMGDLIISIGKDMQEKGFVSLKKVENKAIISLIAVHPTKQRKGIGRTLMAAAETWARSKQCSTLEVSAQGLNHVAIAFYRKNNFTLSQTIKVQHFWKK